MGYQSYITYLASMIAIGIMLTIDLIAATDNAFHGAVLAQRPNN